MRAEAVAAFLWKAEKEWSVMDELVDQGQLISSDYEGHTYYMRRLSADPT